jgi:hypothetical protein
MTVERPSDNLVSGTAGATFGGLIGLWAGTAIRAGGANAAAAILESSCSQIS